MSQDATTNLSPPRQQPVSSDARAMMLFEANRKSLLAAYLFLVFLGSFGGHRFYAGRIRSAIGQFGMLLAGLILSFSDLGLVILLALWIWVIVDAFLLPGWIRDFNSKLVTQLVGG